MRLAAFLYKIYVSAVNADGVRYGTLATFVDVTHDTLQTFKRYFHVSAQFKLSVHDAPQCACASLYVVVTR